ADAQSMLGYTVSSPSQAFETAQNNFVQNPIGSSELASILGEPSDEGEVPEQLFYRFLLKDSSQRIADSILQASGSDRPESLRDLIWRLIFDGRLGLAFNLSRCLEIKYPDLHPIVPSWLIGALALGPRVRYDVGEIASILRRDFKQFNESCFVSKQNDWNQAI